MVFFLFGKFFKYFDAFGDPLLSTSNKSGQKCLSAHFAISNNVSLRSTLAKFEAEPKPCSSCCPFLCFTTSTSYANSSP
ncbi:hypothetical protein II582_00900 [bacterium]|nr:hypothetical protein [bacterium]